ncbi:Ig-like domain-containing protein [Anaerostipes caccae]|uniref:Ig-like domain-containing protein n=1 Tax=Anaerostipes caccae TaxID=105841 RepID=UPI0038D43FCF
MRRKGEVKAAAWLMSVCMLMGSLPAIPGMERKVSAAETKIEGYATKEQLLRDYGMDGAAEKKIGKITFGKNEKGAAQNWYIAGKEPGTEDGLVLFAATAMKEKQKFYNSKAAHAYDSNWECEYETAPGQINANHYGGSDVRRVLKDMSSDPSYFSAAEQKIMRETMIKTKDTKNNSIYTTKDKLYLAQGELQSKRISVGTNDGADLNRGLQIDLDRYLNRNDDCFWLRSPHSVCGDYVMMARSAGSVSHSGDINVTCEYTIVPALQVNLSSVIFASAAPAATSEGSQKTKGKDMILRYNAGEDLGSVLILNHQTVEVNGAAENRYLVVQNKDGAWKKKVNTETAVLAKEVTIDGATLDSFNGCNVWLEKTDSDRITRATRPDQTEEKATVIFKDYDQSILEIQKVNYGEGAKAPEVPKRKGYTFKGWDKDFSKVTEEREVTARYQKNPDPVKSPDPVKKLDNNRSQIQTVVRPGVSITILSGKKFRLSLNNHIKGTKVSYKTSNKKIVSVDKKGNVKGRKAGKATITTTVRQGGKTYTFITSVTVKGYVKLMKLKKTIKKGKTYKFKAKSYGIKGKLKWSVSKKKIGKISKRGKFKAKKKGKVYVIVKCGKYKAKVRVRVK